MFMPDDEVKRVMEFVRSVEVPRETLVSNIRFLEDANRRMYEKLRKAADVIGFYSNVPRAPFARECDGGAAARDWLRVHKDKEYADG